MPGGYKTLLVYRTSVTIFDLNAIFCERFLSHPKHRRTVEQMHHAARSGKQNIAEGSKELSSASEMTLGSVSRSSYTELGEDYEDFLRLRGLPIWDKNDPRVLRIRAFRESVDTPTNLSHLANWTNLDFNNPENFANLMLTLCHKQGYLMDQFLRAKEQKFLREGGFRENLFKKRRNFQNTKLA
ncbi:four helix bundle protein [Candidatus Gottesmanbacteria bacterium]|nr:four helix bundle protein [Candidatus Gottesmanbacteria bacterium]